MLHWVTLSERRPDADEEPCDVLLAVIPAVLLRAARYDRLAGAEGAWHASSGSFPASLGDRWTHSELPG